MKEFIDIIFHTSLFGVSSPCLLHDTLKSPPSLMKVDKSQVTRRVLSLLMSSFLCLERRWPICLSDYFFGSCVKDQFWGFYVYNLGFTHRVSHDTTSPFCLSTHVLTNPFGDASVSRNSEVIVSEVIFPPKVRILCCHRCRVFPFTLFFYDTSTGRNIFSR